MDGLLIVDKPVGPSSHDVVARARRALGERRIGHTGTLDPEASGVLPLVLGKATRLARFLSTTDKSYEAVVRLGLSTTTYDAVGKPASTPFTGSLPSHGVIDAALEPYRGSFLQQPPAYSAKKVGGHPSYKLARRADRRKTAGMDPEASEEAALAPARVSTSALEILQLDQDCVTLRVECSAGFYVRSLAHDLGERLGTGAHLVALRRTRSGDARLQDALPLDVIESRELGPTAVAESVIPLSRMLPDLVGLPLTDEGVRHAGHGRLLRPSDFVNPANLLNPVNPVNASSGSLYRLVDSGGNLIGIARPSQTPGLLHPFVILM